MNVRRLSYLWTYKIVYLHPWEILAAITECPNSSYGKYWIRNVQLYRGTICLLLPTDLGSHDTFLPKSKRQVWNFPQTMVRT